MAKFANYCMLWLGHDPLINLLMMAWQLYSGLSGGIEQALHFNCTNSCWLC
jgi:hypothetical protein